jgi:hypothetical protein
MAHLAKVNGWSSAETTTHVEEAFRLHARRSVHEWALDLTWLSNASGS